MAGSTPHMPLFPFNQWFHAPLPIPRARRVMIAFCNSFPLSLTKVQADPEDRFLLVKGTLQGQYYTFDYIYALNTCTVNFLSKTLRMLWRFREGFLVLGGDFNLTLDSCLDTSSGKTPLSFRALKHIKQLLCSLHLVDSWHALHNRERL